MDEHSPALEWHAPEYEKRERTKDWYTALYIIGGSSAFAATLLDNTLFGVFIVLATLTVAMYSKRPPRIVNCAVDSRGVRVEGTWHDFEDLIAYSVEIFGPDHGRLLVQAKQRIMPLIIIPIEGVDPAAVAEIVGRALPRRNLEEPFLEKLLHYLGI